ncbi:MAG: ABC transporter ATP-binding protein [Pseudanabaenaceae cyanobacterium]
MTREIAIRTVDLTKQFDRHLAVNHIDLEIREGEIYGLIGPNGAGKTTLIRLLAGAEEPTIGEIYLGGERFVRGKANPVLKRRLGYLPDDYPLYDELSVWDYLDYFARLYELRDPKRTQRLYEVLELVNLETKAKSIIATLSRGMKQRLGLARTLVHQPIVLLLDEPASGLDPIARVEFRNVIQAVRAAGMTVLISSHILSDLEELCTAISIMELGCLVESTSLKELYQRRARQQLMIGALEGLAALQSALKDEPHITGWEPAAHGETLMVHFTGDLNARAQLLRSLLERGLSVTEFHTTQEDLESIFFQMGHKP